MDDRGTYLEIRGCFLHHEEGRFWITLPEWAISFSEAQKHDIFELSVFKDLCEYFSEVVPPALIRVTEEFRQKEAEETV